MENVIKSIEKLIEKAANTPDSAEAMRFAQAAQNAAGALCGVWGPAHERPLVKTE